MCFPSTTCDACRYTVAVTTGASTYFAPGVNVTVLYMPAVLGQPRSLTWAVPGSAVQLISTAASNPPSTVQWLKDGTAIAGATSTRLVLQGVSAADAGIYAARFNNSLGWSISRDAVIIIDEAPAIITQPASVAVYPGSSAVFDVIVSGQPYPSFQWMIDFEPVENATESIFVVPDVGMGASALVTVTATNVLGSVSSLPVLMLSYAAPLFTQNLPAALSVDDGQTVVLSVATAGVPTPVFTWKVCW